jgi:uncharacterized protein (DUF1499 family)
MKNFSTKMILIAFLFGVVGCAGTAPQLGVTNGELTPCASTPNCVSSQAKDADHFVEPIVVPASVDATAAIVSAIKNMSGWDIILVEGGYIRVEFVSKIFRFVDDVEFSYEQNGSSDTTIHIRSASRVGYSDMGVNKERVEALRSEIMNFAK